MKKSLRVAYSYIAPVVYPSRKTANFFPLIALIIYLVLCALGAQ